MRYRMNTAADKVSHLIGCCLRDKAEAERMYRVIISGQTRKIDLITGSILLTPEEHAEFVARFSAEVEPTIWTSSFLKH